jgi:hypothetical protein
MPSTPVRRAAPLALLMGCAVPHIPPPANLGAPMPPAAASAEGFDVELGGLFLAYLPAAFHLDGAKALPLGEAPLALELGANLGTGWAGVNPALHWTPRTRPGADWHPGMRLGLLAGVGDVLGTTSGSGDPFLGGSLHAQSSWVGQRGGAITAALGWGYTGHTRCMGGCSFETLTPGSPSCAEAPAECQTTRHSYTPYHAPSLHLRGDIPVGHEGYACSLAIGAQPLLDAGELLPIFELSVGLHHKDPGPRW